MTRHAHGLVIGKFYPLHAGHRLLVDAAAGACDRVTVVPMASAVESVPLAVRVAWLQELYADRPHVRVVGQADDEPVDLADEGAWRTHVALMVAAVVRRAVLDGVPGRAGVDAVFSSEPYGAELARRLGAVDVPVDPQRRAAPVSGRAVRADPVAHWAALPAPVRRTLARRVVVVGAESTGTTTVSRALAARLRARGGPHAATGWVPEVGRAHTVGMVEALTAVRARTGRPVAGVGDLLWLPEDFVEIAHAQRAAEDAAAAAGGPVLVCDTDAVATGVWRERYLGSRDPAVEAVGLAGAAAGTLPSLYLLTDDDGVPFEQDGVRDGEHLRTWMTGRFAERLDELRAAHGTPWLRLTGPLQDRVDAAERAVDALLDRGWGLADPLPERTPAAAGPG